MSGPLFFDTITDSGGDAVMVLAMDDSVILRSFERGTGHVVEVFLDAPRRDRFIKAYAAAERYAEAYPPQSPGARGAGPARETGPTQEGEPMSDTEVTREDGTTAPETYTEGEVIVPGTGTGPGETVAVPVTEAGDDDTVDPDDEA